MRDGVKRAFLPAEKSYWQMTHSMRMLLTEWPVKVLVCCGVGIFIMHDYC